MKKYIVLSRAWYGKANLTDPLIVDEINIGTYEDHDEDECIHSIPIVFFNFSGSLAPRIEIFSDMWPHLSAYQELFDILSKKDDNWTVEKLENILQSLGYEDKTPLTI